MIDGFLDDYAFLIKGLIDFYIATLDSNALRWAKELQDKQNELFWDNNNGGYFYSMENASNVIVRLKDDHDGAEPCGNSVSVRNLILISAYFGDKWYKNERAYKVFDYFSSVNPFSYVLPEMFSAQLMKAAHLAMIVVIGMVKTNIDNKKQAIFNFVIVVVFCFLFFVYFQDRKMKHR